MNGEPGLNGEDFPNLGLLRRNNYGIQSQFSQILSPPVHNCGSCPLGPFGLPGVSGIENKKKIMIKY